MKSSSFATSLEKPLLNNIQALRGIAALLVCTLHFRYAINDPFFKDLLKNGGIGVQIFFMISGFIMVHTSRGIGKDNFMESKRFFIRRIIRIVPLYYFATFLYIADNLNDGYLLQNGMLLLKSLLFISPMSKYIGPGYGAPCIEIGWTLNYEMLFYLLFAASILLGKFRYYFLYALFFVLIFAIPLAFTGTVDPNYTVYHAYSFSYLNILTNPILIHFLLGVTIGLVVPNIKISKTPARLLLLLSFILFLLYYLNVFQIPVNAITDIFFCGFLVTAVILNDYHPEGIKFPPLLVAPGNYSYSLYLLHPLSIVYLGLFLNKIGLNAVVKSSWFFIMAIAFTLLISWLSYIIIEKKFTSFLKSKLLTK